MPTSIDLNADLGEGFGAWPMAPDAELLPLVTSANVACGFHAGDPTQMAQVCRQASQRGTVVGAHVGYRDLAGFGRRFLDIDPVELFHEVIYQIGALEAIASAHGTSVSYLKPHGALYHALNSHPGQARAVVDAVVAHGSRLAVLGMPGALWLTLAADQGLRTFTEAFLDRNYLANGTLVPRNRPDAVVAPEEVAERIEVWAATGAVRSQEGELIEVRADSLCVHGDHPDAVEIAAAARAALRTANVLVAPFLR